MSVLESDAREQALAVAVPVPVPGPGPLGGPVRTHGEFVQALVELAKPRITKLVTMTAGVGFVLGVFGRGFGWGELAAVGAGCLMGTAASAAGANALNQWWECARDALMPRTASRPLPMGRLTSGAAFGAGVLCSVVGVGLLLALCGPAAALVSLATILIYVLVYTPSKPVTPINTLIGAVPGALPPMIGWCAAMGVGTPVMRVWYEPLMLGGGWSLFALMFVWQLPHFFAIAWMYKDDYAAGGHRMLSWYDATGRWTGLTIVATSALLVPATLLPVWALPGVLGVGYGVVAGVTGVVYLVLCLRLLRGMHRPAARRVFLASIIHLPVLLVAMVVEVLVRAVW